MKNSNSSTGGIWMLVGLVALLAAPIAISHFMQPAIAAPTIQASAAVPVTAN